MHKLHATFTQETLQRETEKRPKVKLDELMANRELFPLSRDWTYVKAKLVLHKLGERTVDAMLTRLKAMSSENEGVMKYNEWHDKDGQLRWCVVLHTALMSRICSNIEVCIFCYF